MSSLKGLDRHEHNQARGYRIGREDGNGWEGVLATKEDTPSVWMKAVNGLGWMHVTYHVMEKALQLSTGSSAKEEDKT